MIHKCHYPECIDFGTYRVRYKGKNNWAYACIKHFKEFSMGLGFILFKELFIIEKLNSNEIPSNNEVKP